MPWVINVTVDPDKTNSGGVGTASAIFTDSDGSTFTVAQRASLTSTNGSTFATLAISARNSWQTRKTQEATDRSVLIGFFTNAGETATASVANSGSIILNPAAS